MTRQQLSVERLLEGVDMIAMEALWARHSDEDRAHLRGKYGDVRAWMGRNLSRAEAIGLQLGPPRRVLDLGCGCGYFLHVCRRMGHEVLGIDHPDDRGIYGEVTALLGVPVQLQVISPGVPLSLGGGWGAITAHMVTFNGHGVLPWGAAEWEFFLRDAVASLAPHGVLRLDLNREPDGSLWTRETETLFLDMGAEISGHRATIRRRG